MLTFYFSIHKKVSNLFDTMKKIYFLIVFNLIIILPVYAQNLNSVSGTVVADKSGKPLQNVHIRISKILSAQTDTQGKFQLINLSKGENILQFSAEGYKQKSIPVNIDDTAGVIDLGMIRLIEKSIITEDSLILLTDDDLYHESGETSDNITGLLSASKDLFLRTTAFEFGSTFFKPRYLGSEFQTVLLNGAPLNKLYNGRPQWSNWGGLNDVLRDQVYHTNISASGSSFDDLGGSVNMKTQSNSFRKGFKVSYAASNRGYKHRFMGTYSTGILKNNWSFTFSASYRTANEGFKDGTVYEAKSFFTAIEKKINHHHIINFTAIYADNRRGRSAPVTKEVFDLKNIKYNSYWGFQEEKIRNSRVKKIAEPIFQLNHFWNINLKSTLHTGITFQFGKTGNSRIDYGGGRLIYNGNNRPVLIGGGKNPYPDYYQYLPSYFLRDAGNPDYSGAYLAEQQFIGNGQLNWKELYEANTNRIYLGGNSVYALYDDRNDDRQLILNSIFETKLNAKLNLNAAVRYQNLHSENFACMLDLLGGKGFLDMDIYEEDLEKAPNDLQNPNRIVQVGDRFKYNFMIDAVKIYSFLQTMYHNKKTDAFLAVNFDHTRYQRTGLFENGAYPGAASLGKSEPVEFYNFGVKSGITYKYSGRHLFNAHIAWLTKAPFIQNSFANIRENNETVDDLQPEKHFEVDLEYILRHPKIFAKISTYFIDLKDQTHIGFYFADGLTGLDFAETTAFVQEILSGIDKRNYGVEISVEIPVRFQWKLKAVAALGQSVYSNNPDLYLTSDSFEGHLNYGRSYLKNYFISGGPQQAYSAGIEYNSSNYWWFGTTANYFNNAYINIAPILRTGNFYKDTDGIPLIDYDEEIAGKLLKQEKIDPYFLVNLIAGKSWKFKDYYIGFFASINNVLNQNYRTGGFEQSRNANYKTLLEDKNRIKPLFGPKYWMGYGTTFYTSVYLKF